MTQSMMMEQDENRKAELDSLRRDRRREIGMWFAMALAVISGTVVIIFL